MSFITPSWIVVLPPILVLICTALTKRLNLSLIIGIVSAAFIAGAMEISESFSILLEQTQAQFTDVDNLYLYVFLIIVGILIVLIDRTGGARAFARTLTNRITNSRAAETSSVLLSFALFIDDYLSNLTVGYVMQPLTDKFRIPKAKLAYLVHSVSIPLVIITPISSWMAAITDRLSGAGVAPIALVTTQIIADPFYVYLKSIPYIFYSFIALAGLFYTVRSRISFGPMKQHEHIARTTGHLHGHKKAPTKKEIAESLHDSVWDLIIPLTTLVAFFILGLLYTGGYHLLGGTRSLIDTFKHNEQSFFAMMIAGIIALNISILFAWLRKKIMLKDLWSIVVEGIQMMLGAVIMLTLASILGRILQTDLATGDYLAALLSSSIAAPFMPLVLFLSAAITATLVGSSWVTIALFLPIAIPMLLAFSGITAPATPDQLPLLYPVLGAILSGAVCGDNLSPLSQTTLMAATSSNSDPITHVITQLPYALPAVGCTALGFLIIGFIATSSPWMNVGIVLATCIPLCLATLYILNKIHGNKND
jgi:tetracycline resistance efflux pump